MPCVVVVLPTATYRARDFVVAAGELGVDLVVASDRRHRLAEESSEGLVTIDCDDPESAAGVIAELGAARSIDAVVAADDQGVVVAALAARRLGLPHNDPEAAAATRDKLLMRTLLAAAGVPQPGFDVLEPRSHPDPAGVSFPCVVKPLHLSASRGVVRADDPDGLREAVDRVRAILAGSSEPEQRLLIEEYAAGVEVAIEGLIGPRGFEVLATFDKPHPMEGPYFEETMLVTPSRLPAATVDRVAEVAEAAASALGLSFGPVHAEVRVDGEQVRVIEVAARSIGGLCSRSLRFGLMAEASLEELLLRAALGLPRRGLRREQRASGVMMLPIPGDGVLRRVGWREAALEVPGITGLEITIPIGQRVRPLPEGDRYLGFLFARAETPEEVEEALGEAHRLLDIVVEPLGSA